MNKFLNILGSGRAASLAVGAAAISALLFSQGAGAGQTVISSTPLTSTTSTQVKPNIMLLMDTSVSMGWTHMPDEVEVVTGVNSVGYKAAQCNVLYYNRNQTYALPKNADGTLLPVPSFTSAPNDGFGHKTNPQDLTTTDLSSGFKAWDASRSLQLNSSASDTAQPAYYFYYTGAQKLKYDMAACKDADTGASRAATGGGNWTRVVVSSTSGTGSHVDERTNFAIWYTYYRTRMGLTKSAASLAFTPLTDSFRVGFITVNPKDSPSTIAIDAAKYYQPISDFDTTQRGAWFDKLFLQKPAYSSPAREGLARVGRHFAGKQDFINTGMTGDPVQYSCQQNFAIMMTDGYWNAQAETPGPQGGPLNIDGTGWVGQQDGTLTDDDGNTPHPIWDGSATSIKTDRDALNSFANVACLGPTKLVSTSQRLASTYQVEKTTAQTSMTTQQYTTSTQQWLRTTKQYTNTFAQNTLNANRYSTQTYNITTQTRNFSQVKSRITQSQTQYKTSKSEMRKSTYTLSESSAKYTQGQTRAESKQYVYVVKSGLDEHRTPVSSCTPGPLAGGDTCYIALPSDLFTAATPVWKPAASCTANTVGASSPFIHTDCQTVTVSATANVATCTVGTTTSTTSPYITTTCNLVSTTAAHDVTACTYGIGTTTNGAGTTVCTKVDVTTNDPVPSASCVTNTSGLLKTVCTPTPVQANQPSPPCTVGTTELTTSPYTSTTCTQTINTVNVPVANSSVCTSTATGTENKTDAATSGNSYTATTCTKVVDAPAPINSSCSNGSSFISNGTTKEVTTCVATPFSAAVAFQGATCTAGFAATSPYNFTRCNQSPSTAPVTVPSCTVGDTFSTTSPFTHTVCSMTPAGTPCPPTAPAGTCSPATIPPQVVSFCSGPPTSSGAPNYITTTCNVATIDNNVPAQTCSNGVDSVTLINTTCFNNTSTPAGVPSCTVGTVAGVAPNWINTTCNFTNTTQFSPNAATCASSATTPTAGNGHLSIVCNTVPTPAVFAPAATCPIGLSNSGFPNYINTTCTALPASTPTPQPSCTNSAGSAPDYINTVCSDGPATGPTPAAVCPPETGVVQGPNYIQTACVDGVAPGLKQVFSTLFTTTTTTISGSTPIGTPSVVTSTAGPTDVDGVCYVTGVASPPLVPASRRPVAPEVPLPPASCSAWPCTSSVSTTGGSSNSLADVAQYYYVTDLRPTMTNEVPKVSNDPEDDRATHQHMTTFTIALGVSGTLEYRPDYRSASATVGNLPDEFARIRTGAATWPIWPDPSLNYGVDSSLWNNPRSIDDFWHTAVNGRGQYFSAGSPSSVIAGLGGALAGINARLAAGGAAGVSTQESIAGNNSAFVASYTTGDWSGELQSKSIDLATGEFSAVPVWSAQAKLDAAVGAACDKRDIRLLQGSSLVPFTWNTRTCDAGGLPTGPADSSLPVAEYGNFQGSGVIDNLSQHTSMTDGTSSTVDQLTLAVGSNLVNFIRGQRGYEGYETNTTKVYRARTHVLGDIVNNQPVYVKAPFASYQDPGYAAFKSNWASRTPMIYAGANDGMLHAFYAGISPSDPDAGKEAWAVIPSTVLPNLFKLADDNYKNVHQYFVDGTPTVGDVYVGSTWKTLLVGGLNLGGKGYYAVDVTNPAAPAGKWEFKWSPTCAANPIGQTSDCHLGYTFGKPIITKLADAAGTWVVIVTSGYNNVNTPAQVGDGIGYLYVLDADNGQILKKIATVGGTDVTPSGLAQINNFVDNASVNNTTTKVYGGDGLGKVWRFDVNTAATQGVLIGEAVDSLNAPQPITTRPELAELNGKPMVFVGTGRLLGAPDFTDTQKQSVYGIVDAGGTTPPPASRTSLKEMTLSPTAHAAGATRTVSCPTTTSGNCARTTGWYADLPDSGERVNVNMQLALGTLVVASNVPNSSACSSGGYSWFNYFNFATGDSVTSPNGIVSGFIDNALAVGVGVIRLPDGSFRALVRMSDGTDRQPTVPIPAAAPAGKRISWREIAQ